MRRLVTRILYLQVPAIWAVVPTTNYCMYYKQVIDYFMTMPSRICKVFSVFHEGASYTACVGDLTAQYERLYACSNTHLPSNIF